MAMPASFKLRNNDNSKTTNKPVPLLPLVICYPQIDYRDCPEISVGPDQGCHLSGARTVVVRRITEICTSFHREYFKIQNPDIRGALRDV